MTHFLLKLFLKGNQDYSSPAVRTSVGKLGGLVGILCNALLFLLKLICGILSGSVSILADAVNNLSDAASSVITLLGFHMARRPADSVHPYGHARYEYVSGLVVSFLILLVGFELFEGSIRKIIHPAPIDFSLLTAGILIFSIVLKFWLSRFYESLADKIHSDVLEASSLDSRNDFLSTTGVLFCCMVSNYFTVNIDGIVGLLMACFIFYTGIQSANTTISSLLGKRADPAFVERLTRLVLAHDKILGVHDVLVHDYGPGQCFASLHAEVDAREDPLACHDIIDDIESDAFARLNTHLVIHYDPVVTNDPEWNEMHRIINQIVADMDPRLSLHDFRILQCGETAKLSFDLALPYDFPMTEDQIRLTVYEQLASLGKSYPVVIHFDPV